MHPVPEDFMIWPSKPLSTCVASHRVKRFTKLKDYSRLVNIWVTPCWMRDFNCAQLHTWQMLNIKQSLPYRDFEEQMTLIWDSKWHFCGVQPGSPSFLLIHHPATAPCSERGTVPSSQLAARWPGAAWMIPILQVNFQTETSPTHHVHAGSSASQNTSSYGIWPTPDTFTSSSPVSQA